MMAIFTKTYRVKGLNRNLLLQKLIKNGIKVRKIKIIDEKNAEITLDSKDCLKYFAICKKTWYNELVKVGGFLSPFYLMVKNPVKTIAFLLSLCLIVASDFLCLKTEYNGDSLIYRAKIEKVFLQTGITKYSFITEEKLQAAKSILQNESGVAYLSLTRRGGSVVVDMRILQSEPQKPEMLTTDLIADADMKILSATVYSGTLLKFPNEYVKKGEVIAGAYNVVNGEAVPCKLYAVITAERTFEYEYKAKYEINDQLLYRVAASAKFLLGDYEVLSLKQSVSADNVIKVIIKYEKIICGG